MADCIGTDCKREGLQAEVERLIESNRSLQAQVELGEAYESRLLAEAERLRGIVQADLEEKAEAWGEVERLRADLKRVTGPREPPHCPSCDCPTPSPEAVQK